MFLTALLATIVVRSETATLLSSLARLDRTLSDDESHHHSGPTILPAVAVEEEQPAVALEHEDLGEEWNPWSKPDGLYKGYKDFYGYKVWANSTFSVENGKPNMEINLHGKEKVHCKHEGYDLVMQKPPMKQLILPGWGLVLDCFTEYMKANGAELISMYWNAQDNVLTVNQQLKGHTMGINLYHQDSEEIIPPAFGPPCCANDVESENGKPQDPEETNEHLAASAFE